MEILANNNLSKQVKGNAKSAYLMIFFSWLLLFNKQDSINNSFVKWHIKSSILIHFSFIITYVIFIIYSLFSNIYIFSIWLNIIITNILFTWSLILLIMWLYKAHNWKEAEFKNSIGLKTDKKILDINWDWEISEKEKVTIILSYIPFIGYLNYAKYSDKEIIKNSTRLNIIVSVIISLLYIYWYGNLANLFVLFYLVLICYTGITLFWTNNLFSINVNKNLSIKSIYNIIVTLKVYLKDYFKYDEIKKFNHYLNETISKENDLNNEENELLKTKKGTKLPKFLIYIPFINLIFLFIKNTKYSFHIINGLIITFILSISLLLNYLGYINNNLNIFLLFPICFWIWTINYNLAYRMPIIFDLYVFSSFILSIIWINSKIINEKRKEIVEVNLKVKK